MPQTHWIQSRGIEFLSRLFARLSQDRIDLRHWSIDHVCYRVETLDRYEELKAEVEDVAELLIESEVNGRPIATFRLESPLRHGGRVIDLLELPAPKPGKPTVEGFEHAEVVCDVSFDRLMRDLPHCRFDESGLGKTFNQELEIPLGGVAIKFHHLSLESVVHLESNERVHQAIRESRVLEILKPFRPLIAGTFPLGVDVSTSDVDVLFGTDDLTSAKSLLDGAFGAFNGFESRITRKKDVPSLVARFTFGDVPFELFAQPIEAVEQSAYRHFQIEERLLKLGGADFRRKIRTLRSGGMKTEPAFASALALEGDPYDELLKLDRLDEESLAARIPEE